MATGVRGNLLVVALLILAVPQCIADNILYSGESLYTRQKLSLTPYSLTMEAQCNLVLYDAKKPIWSTKTTGRGQGCRLTLRGDGNLVTYSNRNAVIWASGSKGPRDYYVLTLQKNRNVVVYRPPQWATGTYTANLRADDGALHINGTRPQQIGATPSHADNFLRTGESLEKGDYLFSGRYTFVLQDDCNLELYHGRRRVWDTNTAGAARNCRITLENNGNLAMYDVVRGSVVWSSRSKGVKGFYALVLQNDGNVVIYGPDRWTSGTYIKNIVGVDHAPTASTETKVNLQTV